MPKLRSDEIADIDFDEMESATYGDGDFTNYEGGIPETGTILDFYIKKMWWTRTRSKTNAQGEEIGDKPMIKVLAEASGNQDGNEEYDGLPLWENLALSPEAKFRWAPFFELFGLTPRDIKKIVLSAQDDNVGAPIEKMAHFVPGSEESWCRIVVQRAFNQDGEERAEVKKWLPYDVDEEPEPEEEEPEDIDDEEEDEEDQDLEDEAEEEEEEEAEPEPAPARGRKAPARTARKAPATSQKAPAARGGTRAAKATAPAREPATARRKAPAAKPSAKPAARSRRADAAADDEPPF
jgi:hypothetical protein